ncbi:hypothetical protein NIES4103_29490 [Nostoc sp. NIES-4103]|nr:hypothetical protein NIES4103_29490 [Nostoc sp. NIES-4103]
MCSVSQKNLEVEKVDSNTHDIRLARKLYSFVKPNDVLLGDRAFCAYADMVAITKLGCDVVFRKNQTGKTSMRKGKIVGDSIP